MRNGDVEEEESYDREAVGGEEEEGGYVDLGGIEVDEELVDSVRVVVLE